MARRSKVSRTERDIAALNELGDAPHDAAGVALIEAALAGKDNLVFERASRLAGGTGDPRYVPALLEGFDRFVAAGDQGDAGCRGKFAAVEALRALHHVDDDVYRRGARIVQLEASWGPPTDTAAPLRALCGQALVAVSALDALDVLADHLADREWPVREAAAGSIADLGRAGGAPLLRFKLRVGDDEPAVVAACMDGLLHLDADGALELARDMLLAPTRDTALRETIAVALGESRVAGAEAVLLAWWSRARMADERRLALTCAAMLRTPESFAALLALVRDANGADARDAVAALAPYTLTESARERLLGAAAENEASSVLDAALAALA